MARAFDNSLEGGGEGPKGFVKLGLRSKNLIQRCSEHVLEKEIGWRELWKAKEKDTRGTRGQ